MYNTLVLASFFLLISFFEYVGFVTAKFNVFYLSLYLFTMLVYPWLVPCCLHLCIFKIFCWIYSPLQLAKIIRTWKINYHQKRIWHLVGGHAVWHWLQYEKWINSNFVLYVGVWCSINSKNSVATCHRQMHIHPKNLLGNADMIRQCDDKRTMNAIWMRCNVLCASLAAIMNRTPEKWCNDIAPEAAHNNNNNNDNDNDDDDIKISDAQKMRLKLGKSVYHISFRITFGCMYDHVYAQ